MKDTKQEWFKEAKFGLFIHWGLYSVLAGEFEGKKTDQIAEWIMNHLDIPVEKYEQLAKEFNPTDFDADKIVKLAKSWGMKYVVLTAKHHDGFAMYHSKCSAYNVYDATPCKRDILKELQTACKKEGLKLGLYYSQSQDWHEKNAYMYGKDRPDMNFAAYLENKCLPQLTELLTEYGDISLIWFDTPMGITVEQSDRIYHLVKSLQPNCLVSGRLGNNRGDYFTCGDNFIPAHPYPGDWEVPATLNDTWGYSKFDQNWKNSQEILQLLLKINSRGGNYLLNIGPDGKGNIPLPCLDILNDVGKYVHKNIDSIFATRRVEGNPYELDYGELTAKDNKLFIHVLYKGKNRIELLNLENNVKNAFILENNRALEFNDTKACEGNNMLTIELPEEYQGKRNFCICVEYTETLPQFEPLLL